MVSGRGVESDSWVLLDLDGDYARRGQRRAAGAPVRRAVDVAARPAAAIRDAGEDPRVAGLVVRIRPLAIGWAKAQEIRDALQKFKPSGKPLHAYLELELSGGSMEYYVASVADRVHVPPGAAAPVTGLLAQFVFLGGVWEKLDIDMQVVKIREYKTFGDMLAEKTMTPVASRDGELAARQHVRPAGRRHRRRAASSSRRPCARRSTAGRRRRRSCRRRGWWTTREYPRRAARDAGRRRREVARRRGLRGRAPAAAGRARPCASAWR